MNVWANRSKYQNTLSSIYILYDLIFAQFISDRDTRFDAYRIHILRNINVIYTGTRMFYPTRRTRLILLHYSVGLLRFQFMSLPERHIMHKECMLLHVRDAWWIVRRNEENTSGATQRQKLLRVPPKSRNTK